jgi:hypothetical protein
MKWCRHEPRINEEPVKPDRDSHPMLFTRFVRELQSVHAVSAGLDTEFVSTRPYLSYSFEDVVVQIQSNVVFFDEFVFDSVVESELSRLAIRSIFQTFRNQFL